MAKIRAADVENVVARPDPSLAGALFYGPDAGLIRERAGRITATVAGDRNDPFRVAELDAVEVKSDPSRLFDEVATLSFTGGRRVVRLSGATDGLSDRLADLLETVSRKDDAAFVVVEAGDLGPRSSLRRLFEASTNAVALPCYADEGQTVADLVRATLAKHSVTATPDAVAFLIEHLGNDRMVTRSELDKLVLYAGESSEITLEDAAVCVGDASALATEDTIFSAVEGDFAGFDKCYSRLLLEGITPVAVLRATLRHVQRLHQVAGAVADGEDLEGAIKSLRPRVFFKYERRFRTQLRWWPVDRLGETMAALVRAESACKETGARDAALAERALLMIANAAARARRAR